MAEYSANAVQTVNPGEAVIFTNSPSPCTRGLVKHRDDSGNFTLSGWVNRKPCGCTNKSADYLLDFGANIAVPTGGTVGAITLAFSLDGTTIPTSSMTVTPAAVDEFFNVSRAMNVDVWANCCQTISVRNVSNTPILVRNANLIISRPDLAVTY
ncbi:MAG: hypothetical protein KBT27_03460 [Prevotellaceae bacterium]|nr:hypothetical protein [Candidatus Faecinaster equi]